VTKAGERAVKIFWSFHKDLQVFLKREQKKLSVNMTISKRATKK
jgi:hypothetical protein